MFGYIKPQQSDLLVRQYELYRALYCGLCDTITSKVSPALSLSLSYDFVFLVIIIIVIYCVSLHIAKIEHISEQEVR